MNWFSRLPVQRKLGYAMMLTATVALLLACGVFLIVEYRSYRQEIEQTIATLARLTADNSTAAVAFADRAGARQILEALRAEPQVVAATLYDRDGRIFAFFRPTDAAIPLLEPPTRPLRTSYIEGGRLVRLEPLREGSRWLGTLCVQASLGQIYARMRTFGGVVLVALASSFALAGAIASRLRRTLARPILELASTAQAVSAFQDYSLRARQFGTDELGRLTAAFNAMLAETQAAVGALRESEWSHRELVRALPTAVYRCDALGYITLYNEAAALLWGRLLELGRVPWCGAHRRLRPDGTPLPREASPMARALLEARPVRGEELILERPDGTARSVLAFCEPIRDTAGNVVGTVNMLTDITEQKRDSAAMRRLAAIVESSEDAIIAKDLDGTIISWNRGAERLYGYAATEIIGRSVRLLMPPDRRDEEPEILARIRRDERVEHYETIRLRRDGSRIAVSLTVSPLKDAWGRLVGVSKIARDITARREAEEALRASETQLRLVTDNAPVLLMRADRDYRYTFVNRAYAERSGRAAADMLGLRVGDVIGPEAFALFKPHMDAALAGRRVEFELEIPYRWLGPRWIHAIYVPERDADGGIVGLLGVLDDAGARKEAELKLKRARDEALAASRAKDDFLAALSHELRTPLNPALLLASEAAANPDLPPAVRADFATISRSVNLEARLIDDLLDLTRISRGKLRLEVRPCAIDGLERDALASVQVELQQKRLRLDLDLGASGCTVWGDVVRLQQVFWNILKNAVKFTPEHGRIAVTTRPAPDGRSVRVAVCDSGIGLTSEEIGRVFHAFSQGDHAAPGVGSHRFGGLGLGLTISRMLVEMHKGTIDAASLGRGRGATFTVELPLAIAEPAALPAPAAAPGGGEPPRAAPAEADAPPRRVLLVEDHATTRQTLAALLRKRGFDVAAAESAAEAQRLAVERPFDVVISDIGLPDRTGYELMADLRAIHPQILGVALSGYGMEEDVIRSRAVGFDAHLVKPVTIAMLTDALARLPAAQAPLPDEHSGR
jgi:PAS domain S-box-containing protein